MTWRSLLSLAVVVSGCARPTVREAAVAIAPRSAPVACIPHVTPHGVSALDARGRLLNARGVHLTDWDGFLANPSVTLTLRPPPDIHFPATATVTGDHPRLYFDLPSSVGVSGPQKIVRFETAESAVPVRLAIFPDRDGVDERHTLTLTLLGDDRRVEVVPIVVHDQDTNKPLVSRILVDFGHDTTGFFQDADARAVVERVADDWSYFLGDMRPDAVPAGDETTLIWRDDGFVSASAVQNASAYTGFLLYVYGVHGVEVRSGGEGAFDGKLQTSGGATQAVRRSGGLEVETKGNFNTLGWSVDADPEHWWKTGNRRREPNDLYSIVHHEMGHAHGFNPAYPLFATARETGLRSPALAAYHGGPLRIDVHDHFDKTVDPDSGFGAFGNEYHGVMPARRWLITRLDLLALEAVGYKVRLPTFEIWRDTVPDCP